MTTDTTTPAAAPTPTTAQLVAAFASALLPLAGPTGIAVAAVVPALEQLIASLRSTPSGNFTVEQLVAIVQSGSLHAAQLQQHSDEAAAREATLPTKKGG